MNLMDAQMAPVVEHREQIGRGLSDRSKSPVKTWHSPKGRSSPRRERSPSQRSPARTRSPKRAATSHMKSLLREKVPDRVRSPKHVRGRSPVRTSSSPSLPVKTRHSPKGRSSPCKERSTSRRSPARARSPKRADMSHRKSPSKEKVPDRVRSPKHLRGRAPVRTSSSPSPSPRNKWLRRAQAEREPEKVIGEEHTKDSREERSKGRERESREKERTNHSRSPSPRSKCLMRAQAEKIKEREHGRNTSREECDRGRHGERVEAKEEHGRITSRDEHDRGRHGERGESRDTLSTRRSTRDKSDGGSSRSSRRDRSVSLERRGRSVSPEEHNHRSNHGSRSPSRGSKARAREEASKSRSTEQFRDGDLDSVAKMKAAEESLEAKENDKQKPSYELSGKLAEETNCVGGVTLLFNEPPDARKPDSRWRLYVFKAGEVLNEPLYVHRQSCYLFGRERRVADIPTDHLSCSKQHAVIQYRQVEKEQPDGLMSKQVRPYIMDLGSTNGTFINDNRIEPQRYYELFEKDTIRFGNSSREYVILHEKSAE